MLYVQLVLLTLFLYLVVGNANLAGNVQEEYKVTWSGFWVFSALLALAYFAGAFSEVVAWLK